MQMTLGIQIYSDSIVLFFKTAHIHILQLHNEFVKSDYKIEKCNFIVFCDNSHSSIKMSVTHGQNRNEQQQVLTSQTE